MIGMVLKRQRSDDKTIQHPTLETKSSVRFNRLRKLPFGWWRPPQSMAFPDFRRGRRVRSPADALRPFPAV